MNRKNEIINSIEKISGKYSAYEVFTDWIRCMALAIANSISPVHNRIWEEREAAYKDTMRKYSPEEQTMLHEMTAWLVETLEDGPDDVLGDIYMRSGMGSKAAGQFFTPFHLSVLTARTALSGFTSSFEDKMTKLEINEPSCGGGGMIIAAAKVLQEAGINYQKWMRVIAQDLDWKGVYMCYVQLSLLGINAVCVQGDSLMFPYNPAKTPRANRLYTPARLGALI